MTESYIKNIYFYIVKMWQIHATYIKINEVKPIISDPLFVQLIIIIVCDFINVPTQVEY